MSVARVLVGALSLALLGIAHARVEVHEFADPAKEARYTRMIKELRCLVCQNQNLADSNAELAQDLRQQTFDMIKAGKSDDEIVDFMVTRYGDFVLYRPPFKLSTLVLWVGPFALLGIGITALVVHVRRRRVDDVEVDDQALARARTLLADSQSTAKQRS